MKKIELYKCEICGTQYKDKETCKLCEQSHIKEAPTIPTPQWISVKDRLPHNADEVLIYFSDGIVISGDYFDAVGFIPEHFYDGNRKISHWMPKLEPPEEDVQ